MKEFNEKSRYLFNTWPHDFLLSRQLAEYVYAKGYRNVAIIGAQEVWVKDQTNNFKARFEELGGSVAVLLEPDPSNKVVYSEALKIKNSGADAIVSTTDGVLVGALIAKRAREIGVVLPIYSITIDASTIEAAQGAYEGMEFLTSLTPSPEFKESYEKRYGIPIDIGADSAYDAVMLVAQAMKQTGSEDTAVLQAYLNNIGEYNGVSGHLISDGKGGFSKGYVTEKIINGTAVVIG